MKRFLWLGFVLCLYLICSGCGDTFRPIIIPNPPTFPNPKAAHTVVSINDNGTVVAGSAMVIDVSGDTDVSVVPVDIAPVHAVQQTANVVLVVNQAVKGLNVPTTSCLVSFPPTPPNQVFNVCSSITKLNFSRHGYRQHQRDQSADLFRSELRGRCPDGYDGVCYVADLPPGSYQTSKHCPFGGCGQHPEQQPGGDDSRRK